jgi:hypothetical protein
MQYYDLQECRRQQMFTQEVVRQIYEQLAETEFVPHYKKHVIFSLLGKLVTLPGHSPYMSAINERVGSGLTVEQRRLFRHKTQRDEDAQEAAGKYRRVSNQYQRVMRRR